MANSKGRVRAAASVLALAVLLGAAGAGISLAADSPQQEACSQAPAKACVLDEALAAAIAFPEHADNLQEASLKVGALGKVAAEQLKAGFTEQGAVTIDRALYLYRKANPTPGKKELKLFFGQTNLARALIKAGRLEDLQSLNDADSDSFSKCNYMLGVYGLEVEDGVVAGAKIISLCEDTFERFIDADVRASFLAQVASMQAKANIGDRAASNVEKVLKLLTLTPAVYDKLPRSTFLAVKYTLEAQILLGQKDQAKALLSKAFEIVKANPQFRNDFLRGMFFPDRLIGGIIDVKPLAAETSDEEVQSIVLAAGAIARANLGQIAEAQSLAGSIKDDYYHALALAGIVRAQEKAGDVPGAVASAQTALKLVRKVQKPLQALIGLIKIAEALPLASRT